MPRPLFTKGPSAPPGQGFADRHRADLTAELLARDEAEARREEAETKNNLLRLVLEQSGAGVIMADEKGMLRIFQFRSRAPARQRDRCWRPSQRVRCRRSIPESGALGDESGELACRATAAIHEHSG